jgi:hypothetical protein
MILTQIEFQSTSANYILKIKKQDEAEIASSAEHLLKETFFSIVNQSKITVCFQVARERRMYTRRRIIYKKIDGRVTQSQAHPLYSLDYCAAGKASEANWKHVILS